MAKTKMTRSRSKSKKSRSRSKKRSTSRERKASRTRKTSVSRLSQVKNISARTLVDMTVSELKALATAKGLRPRATGTIGANGKARLTKSDLKKAILKKNVDKPKRKAKKAFSVTGIPLRPTKEDYIAAIVSVVDERYPEEVLRALHKVELIAIAEELGLVVEEAVSEGPMERPEDWTTPTPAMVLPSPAYSSHWSHKAAQDASSMFRQRAAQDASSMSRPFTSLQAEQDIISQSRPLTSPLKIKEWKPSPAKPKGFWQSFGSYLMPGSGSPA